MIDEAIGLGPEHGRLYGSETGGGTGSPCGLIPLVEGRAPVSRGAPP